MISYDHKLLVLLRYLLNFVLAFHVREKREHCPVNKLKRKTRRKSIDRIRFVVLIYLMIELHNRNVIREVNVDLFDICLENWRWWFDLNFERTLKNEIRRNSFIDLLSWQIKTVSASFSCWRTYETSERSETKTKENVSNEKFFDLPS